MTNRRPLTAPLKLIIKILLFQYIRYIDGIYICILFIWIRIITLVSLLHLPTSVRTVRYTALSIVDVHRLIGCG